MSSILVGCHISVRKKSEIYLISKINMHASQSLWRIDRHQFLRIVKPPPPLFTYTYNLNQVYFYCDFQLLTFDQFFSPSNVWRKFISTNLQITKFQYIYISQRSTFYMAFRFTIFIINQSSDLLRKVAA